MTWRKTYYYLPQYEYTSVNQHGTRFKQTASKKLNVARLSCKFDDEANLIHLVLLSHTLNVPVHFDFEDNKAYIEVISADTIKGIK